MPGTNETLIILAAGRGSRLGSVQVPKWLLPVNGRALAEVQLSALPSGVLEGFSERLVVAGFASQTVEAFVGSLATPFRVLVNNCWRELNNWYSLLIAFDYLSGSHFDGSVLLLNSDLLFSSATVAPFFAEDHDRGGEIDIVVDFDKELRDEAMKVSCQMSDVAHVTGIGKTEVRHPLGEDIGMWRLSPTGWRRLRAALQQFVGATGCEQLWYQNALASVIDEDLCAGRASIVRATPTGESAWIEIDDRRDLQLAERLAMKEFFPGSRASSNNAEALG